MILNEFFDMLVTERKKIKSKRMKSPTKKSQSPVKGDKENDENSSPGKSPDKQERRSRNKEEEIGSIYLQEIKPVESPEKKSCRKSPLKRMRNLEEQDNLENQENIETTYRKSPAKILIGGESPISEEVLKAADELQEAVEAPKEFSAKTLLGTNHQAMVQTQSQQEAKVTPISEILDIDSNVINYGQFICGKILGSTLLLSNVSKED